MHIPKGLLDVIPHDRPIAGAMVVDDNENCGDLGRNGTEGK
jgi:hypothetical protein